MFFRCESGYGHRCDRDHLAFFKGKVNNQCSDIRKRKRGDVLNGYPPSKNQKRVLMRLPCLFVNDCHQPTIQAQNKHTGHLRMQSLH